MSGQPVPTEVFQVVFHPLMWGWLKQALSMRGFDLVEFPVPASDEDQTPTYMTIPR